MNDLLRRLRLQRIDGRSDHEAMRDAAAAIEVLEERVFQMDALRARVAELEERVTDFQTALPLDAYHEDQGAVLWWRFPIVEPPYCGQPGDDGWTEDYYTHWSPLPEARAIRCASNKPASLPEGS